MDVADDPVRVQRYAVSHFKGLDLKPFYKGNRRSFGYFFVGVYMYIKQSFFGDIWQENITKLSKSLHKMLFLRSQFDHLYS